MFSRFVYSFYDFFGLNFKKFTNKAYSCGFVQPIFANQSKWFMMAGETRLFAYNTDCCPANVFVYGF